MATSGDAELLLIPRVDHEEMRRTANRMSDALERATEQASAEMQRDLRRGVGRGINQGINDGEMGFSKLKLGLASIAVAAGSLITDSIGKAVGGADETLDKILERAERIKSLMGQSSALGIDQGSYAAWSIASMGKGVEQEDLLGMMSGFSEGLNDDKLALYKNIRDKEGLEEAFFRMIYTASTMSADKGHTWLADDVTLGSDANFANKLADIMREMSKQRVDISKESFFKYAGVSGTTEQLSNKLDRSKNGLNLLYKTDQEIYEKSLGKEIKESEINAYKSRQQVKSQLEQAHIDNVTLKVKVANFQDKMEIKQIDATISTLNAFGDYWKEMTNQAETDLSAIRKDPLSLNSAKIIQGKLGKVSPLAIPSHLMLTLLQEISDKLTPDKHKQNTDNNNLVTGKD